MASTRERFRQARIAAGINQRAYARQIGKHKGTVNRWEKGFTDIPLDELVKAARIFRVRREWLVFGSGAMRSESTTAEAG